MSLVSFVLPAYRESTNLRVMVDRIARVAEQIEPHATECIVVDDHSPDDTPVILGDLARTHPWVRFARLAKNSGSHVAIITAAQAVWVFHLVERGQRSHGNPKLFSDVSQGVPPLDFIICHFPIKIFWRDPVGSF